MVFFPFPFFRHSSQGERGKENGSQPGLILGGFYDNNGWVEIGEDEDFLAPVHDVENKRDPWVWPFSLLRPICLPFRVRLDRVDGGGISGLVARIIMLGKIKLSFEAKVNSEKQSYPKKKTSIIKCDSNI